MLVTYTSALAVLLLFVLTIAGLIKYQSNPERVFGVLLLVLFVCGFVSSEQVVSSFASQGVLTLVLLMVCSLALEKTRFYARWRILLSGSVIAAHGLICIFSARCRLRC